MKTKKLFLSLASAVLACALCVGFAACGDDVPSAEDIEGEEVTAEQWEAAFSEELFSNFKIEIVAKSKNNFGGMTSESTVTTTVTRAGDFGHYKSKTKMKGMPDYNVDRYDSIEYGGAVTYTLNSSGEWIANRDLTSTDMVFDTADHYTDMADKYEDYVYKADVKGYVDKDQVDFPHATVYKFKDGKLAGTWRKEETGEGTDYSLSTMSYVFTFGGQSVTLPDGIG